MGEAVTPPSTYMDAAVDRLIGLAADLNRARAGMHPQGSNWPRLFTMADFPEPTPEYEQAQQALQDFGNELAAIGGINLQTAVYDEAVDRWGHRAVGGVSAAWSGTPAGWWH